MADCIFCKISAGDIPATKLYEDDYVVAFLDIAPVSKGHALVLPKKHVENLLEAPHEMLSKTLQVVQRIAGAQLKALDAKGFNVFQNNGAAAGQSVLHLHFHVVPRFEKDGLEIWIGNQMDQTELAAYAEKIKKHL